MPRKGFWTSKQAISVQADLIWYMPRCKSWAWFLKTFFLIVSFFLDAYPILTHTPTLSHPVLTPTDYEFRCHIPYPSNKQDAIFEVTWFVDGKTSIHTETLTADQRDATLSGEDLEGHLNSVLSCSVVSSFVDQHTGGLKSPAVQSAGYWVGVKVKCNS